MVLTDIKLKLFSLQNLQIQITKNIPEYITKLYAVRDSNGAFKLENCINYDTRNWEKYQYGFINYVVHPDCTFNKKEAIKANDFCKIISKRFKLKILPFKYYLLPNNDALGKLYNFEYWMSYVGGQAYPDIGEIFTTYSNENYPH
ncbi:hypothetical protein [Flavobacterium agrisoli]|uniref:Uncharacterized protein n=1 Tax=Flavobacterium agrisoli TaxID=2793066 RepID=A0A934PMI3_9FLAO|nr:hypothetical protein [Flavobacterium agrisoli]MBK0369118.1 hypothetical protein [Flavobacterium agrisoli]